MSLSPMKPGFGVGVCWDVERSLFDARSMPVRMRGRDTAAGAGGAGAGSTPPGDVGSALSREGKGSPLSVSQLSARIDTALSTGIPGTISVVGEVSNFTDRTHWYFGLKDADAVVSCVMFQSAARKAKIRPGDGQSIVARGRVEFYAKSGRVSFIVDSIEPVGVGALELAFRKLCEEIRALGWFADERKRALPAFPRKIGVVTSRTGAALQDVLDTMRRRCPAVGVVLADVRVQGEGSAGEVARAIATLGARHRALGVDAILVTRGGGSMEDLWAFNEKVVAEAIVRSPIPVVAAIGHETDTTIAELVADVRAATPTQAAMRLTPDREDLARQADSMRRRLHGACARATRIYAERLRGLERRPGIARPETSLAMARERMLTAVDSLGDAVQEAMTEAGRNAEGMATRLRLNRPSARLAMLASSVERSRLRLEGAWDGVPLRARLESAMDRLRQVVQSRVVGQRKDVESAERTLEAVGPAEVLRRGFSVTLGADGRAIRSVGAVTPGDRLTTVVADGRVESVVDGSAKGPTPRRASAKKPERPQDGEPGLFA
ncbi:MAG: exodeoxyribonuclease VII large subunit [Phycisphaerales bacterium]